MTASSTVLNSTDIIVQITEDSGSSYDTVGTCTSANFSMSMDVRDVTTKDSSGVREILPGKLQGNISFEGFVVYATSTDVDRVNNIIDLMNNKTEVGIRYGRITTGEYVITANGLFTSVSLDAGVEDNHTYSVQFEIDGPITQASYS